MPYATDLITSAELLAAWPQASALPTAEQAALLTAGSLRVQSECDRVLVQNTFQETHRPGRSRKVYLRQRPVTAVTRVGTDLASVLTVQSTDAAVTRALVGFTITPGGFEAYPTFSGLTLTAWSGGVQSQNVPLAFATYPTLTALAAAINALSGWSATVTPSVTTGTNGAQNYGQWASTDLTGDVGQMGASLLAVSLKAYTRDVPFACDQDAARKGVVELFEGRPDGYRYPDRRYGGTGYASYGVGGYLGGGDPRSGAVQVWYTAGYPVADVPGDLKRAAVVAAKYLYDATKLAGGYSSETFKDYSYSRDPKVGLPAAVKEICFNHSRKEVA